MGPALVLILAALAQTPAPVESVSSFPPRSPADERRALHVPEGFEVQLVAAEPDIQKPINIAFDDRGRLWVTGSYEYPFPAPEGKVARDTVKVLEDFRPDGRAAKITTFAAGLNIPIGLLPLPGGRGALVYSIPRIDRFLDTDGDGRADRREPFYQAYGHRDTHGMTGSFTWGFDGWVYACHGFANDSTVKGADQRPIAMNSGNIYRMKLDGSHAEYFTHGQVNPFGLALDPLGDLFSSDCHSRPLYLLLRGAFYPSFGKPDDGLGFGPEMMSHDHGSTAIDGATYYADDQFPVPYRDTLFVGNVMTNRINHDRLEWRGSSPRAIAQPDFVWSEDNWFRPVDIELGPDGALYVADFYNRIIGHYEVPLTHPGRDHDHGRIWRIVYRGADGKNRPAAPRPDLSAATVDELIEDLGHANLAVRIRAANQLVERADVAPIATLTTVVTREGNPWRRVHALWVLQRLGALDESMLAKGMQDPDRALRVHAMRVLGERPTFPETLARVARRALTDTDPFVRRVAAEALGRHPDLLNIRPLLDLRHSAPPDDTHLIHVVRMALRDQLRESSAWSRLEELKPSERDAQAIADVATGVPSTEAASYLLRHIGRWPEPRGDLIRFVHHVARYADNETSQALVRFVRGRAGRDRIELAGLLQEIQQGMEERGAVPGDELRDMAQDLSRAALASATEEEVLLGIGLASSFKLRHARPRLEALAKEARAPASERAAALEALVTLDAKGAVSVLGQVLRDATTPAALRDRSAVSLAGIDQPEARQQLIDALPTAPDRLETTIAAGLANRKPGAEALLKAVMEGKASARVLQQQRVAGLLNNAGIPDLESRLAVLLKGLPPADRRLQELLNRRRAGFGSARHDLLLGAKAFEQNCANCHQIGGKGARIGPQLDGVGARGVDRLLEDMLDPSRNVDQAFRTTIAAMKTGQVVSGLLLREDGAVLVFADAQGKEVRVPKDMVEERTVAQLSPMPANFADQLPESDLYNLLAFLLAQAKGPQTK